MIKTVKLTVLFFLFAISSYAQVGMGTFDPNLASSLDVTSTSKGFLLPRMTLTQRNSINEPAAGLQIWCLDCGSSGLFQVFNGFSWTNSMGVYSNLNVPDTPTNVLVTETGNSQVSIAFTPPVNNGGSVITGYTVTASPGGITAIGLSSPIVVTGLTAGTSYTFTVVATNAIGNSDPATSTSLNLIGNFYWNLEGNSSTIASHALGTMDSQSLAIKTNNVVRLSIDSNGEIDLKGNSINGFLKSVANKTDSYTLAIVDSGKILTFDSSNTTIVTVPIGLPVGFTISILQKGIGQIEFSAASGVVINNRGGYYSTVDTFSMASLISYASNTMVLTGDLD